MGVDPTVVCVYVHRYGEIRNPCDDLQGKILGLNEKGLLDRPVREHACCMWSSTTGILFRTTCHELQGRCPCSIEATVVLIARPGHSQKNSYYRNPLGSTLACTRHEPGFKYHNFRQLKIRLDAGSHPLSRVALVLCRRHDIQLKCTYCVGYYVCTQYVSAVYVLTPLWRRACACWRSAVSSPFSFPSISPPTTTRQLCSCSFFLPC